MSDSPPQIDFETERPRRSTDYGPQRRTAPANPWLSLPLRTRYAITFFVSVAIVVALVVFVNANTADKPTFQSAKAEAEANEESNVLIEEDQAPRTAVVAHGQSPAAGVTQAVSADMNRLIDQVIIYGPLKHVGCHQVGGGGRLLFHCTALANGVNYPFDAVVASRQITYCKVDPPPVPSENLPVSPRCR